MALISLPFFLLLALTIGVYYLFSTKNRWIVLLLASLIFYVFSDIYSLIFILIFTLSSYLFALLIEWRDRQESAFVTRGGKERNKKGRNKKSYLICIISVAMLLSIWIFARKGIRSALGISFYSLRVISYLIDVYRGRVRAQTNIFKYALFVTFFPLAYLGPVARYKDIGVSLYEGKRADAEEITSGLLRLLYGVFKKTVIANALSVPLSNIAESPQKYLGAYTLFLLVFYSAEIYCDFSGGIDICIGASRMLGIALPENFERPFASQNVREFWNRWHISLGEWFETYVFYPLSLSRPMQRLSRLCREKFGTNIGKRLPLYAATLFTWTLTGLWHGARWHFIAWGVINGVIVIISQELSRPIEKISERHPVFRESGLSRVFGRVRVFMIIGTVRLLDVYQNVALTARMLLSVFFQGDSYEDLIFGGIFEIITPQSLSVILISLVIVFLVSSGWIKVGKISKRPFSAVFCGIFLILSSLVFGTYGIGFDASDFIYSHFNGGGAS